MGPKSHFSGNSPQKYIDLESNTQSHQKIGFSVKLPLVVKTSSRPLWDILSGIPTKLHHVSSKRFQCRNHSYSFLEWKCNQNQCQCSQANDAVCLDPDDVSNVKFFPQFKNCHVRRGWKFLTLSKYLNWEFCSIIETTKNPNSNKFFVQKVFEKIIWYTFDSCGIIFSWKFMIYWCWFWMPNKGHFLLCCRSSQRCVEYFFVQVEN